MHLSFLCLGICVHLLLLYSIFDIYYSSPIIKNARSFPIVTSNDASVQAPADRLVFFSAGIKMPYLYFGNTDIFGKGLMYLLNEFKLIQKYLFRWPPSPCFL